MTRTTASLAAALALLGAPAAVEAASPSVPRGRPLEYEASARARVRLGRLEPVADLSGRWQYEGRRPYRAVMLGAYGRATRHLKVGAFWRVQYGARHDDDWVREGPGRWGWRDTTRRPEHLAVLDATPRAALTFLPGTWTAALKLRWEHNFFNRHGTAKIEPELGWFYMDGLAPRASAFLRYGHYQPLNFGGRRVYERWWYLSGLWHPNDSVVLGPSIAHREEFWMSSSDFRAASPGREYRALYRSLLLGFAAVARWR